MADYSSRDTGSLNEFLQNIGPEYTIYTYSMLNAGVDKEFIRGLSDEQLENECRIVNSIHRLRILNAIRGKRTTINQFDNFLYHEASVTRDLVSFMMAAHIINLFSSNYKCLGCIYKSLH